MPEATLSDFARVTLAKALRELAKAGCLSNEEANRLSYFILTEVFSPGTVKRMAEDLFRDAVTCLPKDGLAHAHAMSLLKEVVSSE